MSVGSIAIGRLFEPRRPSTEAAGAEAAAALLEKIFVFCLVWSLGASVTEDSGGRVVAVIRLARAGEPRAMRLQGRWSPPRRGHET